MPTDDIAVKKWDQLKAMREKYDTPAVPQDRTPDGKFASPDAIKEENEKLKAGEPVGGTEVVEPEAPEVDDDDDDDDDDPEPVALAATPEKPDDAPPGTEAVEIDGRTVYVDPALAAAYRADQEHKSVVAETEKHDKLVADITERVAAKLPQPTLPDGQKTAAEIAADKVLADADIAPALKQPSASLQITDEDEYNRQMAAFISDQAERKVRKIVAEQQQKDAISARENNARIEAQREAQAQEILGTQFYNKYPVLSKPETKELVDILLNKKFEEVKVRLRTNPLKSAAEGEALKDREFAAVAAEATRKIVAIRGPGATANVAPPPPPPKVTSSHATRATDKAPKPVVAKPREKFPSGSVSAMLSKHQANKRGATV